MADETKKVILQLQIDQAQSITQIAALKTQIAALKTEQQGFNTETEQGQKDSVAYAAQIKVLTSQQKDLENALADSIDSKKIQQKIDADILAAQKAEAAQLKINQKAEADAAAQLQADAKAEAAAFALLQKAEAAAEKATLEKAKADAVESGSIQDNRNQLKLLTAEYLNLAAPTTDQTNKIKTLSDTLKAQESAIGNNTRNVGNYSESFAALEQSLQSFSPQISALVKGFSGMQSTLGTVAKGFTTLKGAIAATGIGVLLLLLGSLISYIKNTDEGATALQGVFSAVGIVVKKVTGFFAELGSQILDLFTSTKSFGEILSNLGDVIIENTKSRIEGLLNIFVALGDVIDELVKNGFSGDFKPALKDLTDATIQAGFGIKDSTDKIAAFAQELADAAKVAYDFAIKVDALDDAQRALNLTNAKSDQIVQQLIISAKNRTLTDQERIDLLLKANTIEETTFASQQQIDKARLALISQRNAAEKDAINQQLNRDIAETTSEEKKIKLRQQALSIADEQTQEEADLQKKVIDGETQYILLKEKNQNKIDVFNDKIAADREKAYQEYLKQLADINGAELTLEDQRQAQALKDLQYEESLIGKSDSDQIKNLKALGASKIEIEQAQADERVALLQQIAEQEIAIEKKLANDKLAALTSEGLAEDANQKEIEIKKQTVIEDANAKRIQAERQLGDQIEAINQKTNDDIAKSDADALAKKKANTEKTLNTIGQTLNNFAQTASQANQDHLNAELADDESARATALQQAGTDAAKQAAVNKKYDDLEASAKKKAAKADLDLKEIQAVANVALGISQAIAEGGLAGIVTGALVAAAGAVQIADIESQKSKLAKGGLLNGPSHNYGGITGTGRFGNIEVEGGEFVMNKYSTKRFLPLLHRLNSSAPNRAPISFGKMAAGGQIYDGGLSARQSLQDVNSNLNARNLIMDAITRQPAPVVLVKDINNGQNRNIIVKDRANVTG